MTPVLLAAVVFVLVGLTATWLLRRRSANGASAGEQQGIAYLSSLHWRDLARLVLQAMEARGYKPVTEDGMPADALPMDGSDTLLQRGNQQVLLSSKYGSAAMVGPLAIKTLIKAKELRGADSAIVVSTGHFDEEAERLAKHQLVELVNGEELWREVKPFVPSDVLAKVASGSSASALAPVLAWVGAAALGGVVWLVAQGMQAPADSAAAAAATVVVAPKTAQPKTGTAPAPKAGGTTPPATAVAEQPAPAQAAAGNVPDDEASLMARRLDVASAISTLAGVDRAVWSTQSTLLVYLDSENADPSDALCPLLERYPELAASRVQLQQPPDSQKPVRFKQCRSY